MSPHITRDVQVTDSGPTESAPIAPSVVVDGQDAWVELTIAPHNLREIIRGIAQSLAGHHQDLLMVRHGGPLMAGRALDNLVEVFVQREVLVLRLDPADTDALQDDLAGESARVDGLERCGHPSVDCRNLCEPGFTRCPVHAD